MLAFKLALDHRHNLLATPETHSRSDALEGLLQCTHRSGMESLLPPTMTAPTATALPPTRPQLGVGAGIFGAVLAIAVLIIDINSPRGLGESVLYVIVVLIVLVSTRWRYGVAVAAGCTALSIIGYVYSPPGATVGDAVTNRVYSLLAIWVTTIMGMRKQRATDELAKSETRLRTIVDSVAEGILTMDERGAVESWNRVAQLMFGYPPHEVIGRGMETLIATDGRSNQGALLNLREPGLSAAMREVRGVRKDGATFPALLSVNQMWLGDRRMFTGIILDMTDLRRAQRRAVQAERLAAIGEAMTGLAHESRNALQRSQAALEMLARSLGNRADVTELIGRIQTAQDDLHRLYEEVRRYASPVNLQPGDCRIDELLDEAWGQISVSHAGRDTQLQQRIESVDLHCKLDRFAMLQVFRNILDNSLAAVDGSVSIRVDYAQADLNGRPAVEMVLGDNGPGIEASIRAKLFEPFFTTKTSGTGLGLAIAKRLIEAHGGVIDLLANSGPGAAFRIILPRNQA